MSPRHRAFAGTALIAIALAVLPLVVGNTLGNTWVRVLDYALLYIILALGLNIVVGFAGLLDLGYIAFYAVGAYLYALLASPHFGLHWPAWAILPLGALVAGFFGVLLGAPTLRLRGDYLAIVTLGFGEIIRIFLNNLNQPVNITNGPKGIARIDAIGVAGHPLAKPLEAFGVTFPGVTLYYYLFVLLAIAIVFVGIRLQDSRIGRAWVAIREDEIAAKACGINTRNVKLLAFAMGASFGGVAGGLFAGFQEFVSPESFGLLESIMVLCMVVLGGMGHIPGVILGGLLLTLLPEAFRYGAGPLQQAAFGRVLLDPESLRMLLFGIALILVMLYRPAGLWPEARHRREFAEKK
ncbi:ABC transporter permease subunit [Sulfurisoma sediminicola]|uniref:Amino acid/amide ABC transporter membrane protein 2 (HAAT family) n=1 Tax=Sulfurisoma sediminicola TaxID=1381557 RepID=A0A497XLT4_9PROT|nr:ABC transporter ATP-binding protein [Sulfurisoma sediminicola]RLJ68377.1 amino acid/amide ABC transporter membrane protein 2 (HAAT family) [Sulfurisoma sediminicola]